MPLDHRPLLALAALGGGCGLQWSPSFDESIDLDALDDVPIAAPEVALSFARYAASDGPRTLLVLGYQDGYVEGVDLSEAVGEQHLDPVQTFRAMGYEALQAIATSTHARARISSERLVLPLDFGPAHIAAGTNYPEHAGEVGLNEDDEPYLFPKLVRPTPFDAPVSVGQALLDYEVELGFVALEPIEVGSTPKWMGLILCNDFTDRALLLRSLDPDDVTSGKGFTTGKSRRSFLPVGQLLVIPRDYRSFAAETRLKLYVNLALRQQAYVSEAIWDIDAIFREIWAREGVTWDHRGRRYPLFTDRIEAGTIIMSGTPYGVVFNEVGTEPRSSALLEWLAGGWDRSFADHAIEDYITDAKAAGIYLLTGDRVDIHVEHMGTIHSEVQP